MTNKEATEPLVLGNKPPVESSPLLVIQQKEVEINSGILKAKRQAEETVAKARMKAIEIREQAEKEGAKKAKDLNKREVAKAKKQAERARASAVSECEKVREIGQKNLNKAVAFITDVVAGRGD